MGAIYRVCKLMAALAAGAADSVRRAGRRLWSYSIRTQLILVLFALTAMAWIIGAGITIVHARKATHIEINAAMELAEALVRDAIPFVQQSNSPDRALASIPDQVGSVRHVRISVTSDGRSPSRPLDRSHKDFRRDEARTPAPDWFTKLIAPPFESREVAVFVNEKQLGAIVIASEPGDEIAEVWENATSLAGVALLTGIISIIILYIVFGRVLAPLRSLAEGLRDLGLSDFRVRLLQPKARELSTIAQRFNSLASALETMMVKNRKLSTRLITVQDDERRQTALNLHDEVGPYLFGLKANATSIVNSSKGSVAEIRAREMLAMIDALQSINRRVLTQLRPMALGQVPLGELLSSLIAERAHQFPDMSIALLLAAGQLAGIASRERTASRVVARISSSFFLIVARVHLTEFQPIDDVLGHRHVRPERIALEDHRHVAPLGRHSLLRPTRRPGRRPGSPPRSVRQSRQ